MQLSAQDYLKQADPILGQVIDHLGERQLIDVPFEYDVVAAVAKAIIYQQISLKAAATISKRFFALYTDSELTAQTLWDTPEETLRSVGISRPKIRYLQDLAEKVLAGLPTMTELEGMEDEAIIQTLTQIKGVGRWSAEMVLMFALQRPDVLPVNDLGIRTAIKTLYNLETLPDKKTIEYLGKNWKPYRSLACRYLWSSFQL